MDPSFAEDVAERDGGGRRCTAEECDRPHLARGLCVMHYARWRKDPNREPPEPPPTLLERFWSKVDKNGPVPAYRPALGPCWIWTARCRPYGVFSLPRVLGALKTVYAHRFAYELLVGPIPEGLELDHLCRVPRCCNPAHLEPVTRRENQRRGFGPPGVNARKTHCLRGHPFEGSNLIVLRRGGRCCRLCAALRHKGPVGP